MFGKAFSISFCTVLVLCWVLGLSSALPVRRAEMRNIVARQQLESTVPGAQIQPVLVDLLDQYKNFQQQLNEASEGSPNRAELVKQLDDTRTLLEEKMKGIAILVSSTLVVPTSTSTSSSDSASSTPVSSTVFASSSTISPPPSSVSTNVPVVTIVTQEGTSAVVIASQGVTSTISLATLTQVPSASPTSSSSATVVSASESGSATVSASTTITSPGSSTKTVTESSTITATTTVSNPLGTAANSSAQDRSSSAGMRVIPSTKVHVVLSVVVAALFGTWTVL